MSDLVGNPEDRFSCVATHILIRPVAAAGAMIMYIISFNKGWLKPVYHSFKQKIIHKPKVGKPVFIMHAFVSSGHLLSFIVFGC